MNLCIYLAFLNVRMIIKSSMRCSKGEGKDKAKWDDNKTEMFLEEINARNKLTNILLEKDGKIYKRFQEKAGSAYDKTKLKNRWDD